MRARPAGRIATLLLFTTLIGPTSLAGEVQDVLRARLLRAMPKGWRELPRRPAGIVLLAHGPRTREGAAVIAVRRYPKGAARPRTAADVAALAEALGENDGFAQVDLFSPAGPVLDAPARGGRQVRYVLHSSALLTITAPPRLLRSATTWVREALGAPTK